MTGVTAVTWGRESRQADCELAWSVAAELGAAVVPRRERTVANLLREEQLPDVVVASGGQLTWRSAAGGAFFFHPNMAVQRLRQMANGGGDVLVRAAGLRTGDCILDATLGLGADAIVASHVVGPAGRVLGLERSPIIATLVRRGLASYAHRFEEAMRRVEVQCADHRAWLAVERSPWDVIWFDPMFGQPVGASRGLDGLRYLACGEPLDEATIALAQRRARRMVLVKWRTGEPRPPWFRPDEWVGARGAAVHYAVFGPLAEAEGET